ncbi:MAG: class I SAM-dependent methyltransferase [Rhizomicrobium sp.]
MAVPASPLRLFEALGAFQRTAALRAAIELDIFTAIAAGANTAAALAEHCAASERGIRVLADYLAMLGFLEKRHEAYSLATDAAAFLDRRATSYIGAAAAEALSGGALHGAFASLPAAVRRGGTAMPADGTLAPDHPLWVDFARAMSPSGAFLAHLLAERVVTGAAPPARVLDIAAGHGLFGIEFVKRNPHARSYAVDWPGVLTVARENAAAAGVTDRCNWIPGDVLRVDLGDGYDMALVTNFCPDLDTTADMLRRLHAALADNGRVAMLEVMLDDDRISPREAVALNLGLLATTASGGTRTPSQLAGTLRSAEFAGVELHDLPPAPHRVMIARKA